MTRNQIFIVLAIYLVGALACAQWALSLDTTWLLGFVLWSSFYGFCNALFWMAYWGREHWMG